MSQIGHFSQPKKLTFGKLVRLLINIFTPNLNFGMKFATFCSRDSELSIAYKQNASKVTAKP